MVILMSGLDAREASSADLVLLNGEVITMGSKAGEGEAFAVKDGRIMIVGSG